MHRVRRCGLEEELCCDVCAMCCIDTCATVKLYKKSRYLHKIDYQMLHDVIVRCTEDVLWA